MSSSARGRGGKFNKPKRGGGKYFSRDLQPLNKDGEVVNMWADPEDKDSDEEDEDEEDSEEESSEDDAPGAQQEEMTREQRKAQAKARKEAAIAKKQRPAEPGDLPPSDSEEEDDDDDMPANPNHTAKARSMAAGAAEASKVDGKTPASQLSRREREALQAQQAKERYQKLHAAGKTDEARADLERLALVREKREAEAARKKAEAEERAEHEKAKADQIAREERMRAQARGTPKKKGGKKK